METLQKFHDIDQQLTGKFVVIPSNFVQNALHVCVDEEDIEHVPQLTDCKHAIIGLLRNTENSHDAKQGDELFVTVGVLPKRPAEMHGFPEVRTKEDNCVHLHCTNTFLNHYNFSEEDRVNVRCVQTFPLQKVVFCVKTEKAFAWANRHFFSSGLLLSVCQEKVLIRKNDWLLAGQSSLFLKDDGYETSFLSDVYIVDCEPLNQGILGINTQVVVLKLYEDESLIDQYKSKQVSIDRVLPAPLVSNFAKNLVKKDPLCKSNMPTVWRDLQATLKPFVISKYANWLNLVGRDYKHDNLATVVMNTSSAKLIGAFNESLVNIRLAYKDSEGRVSTSKVARTVLVKVMTSSRYLGQQKATGRSVQGDHCGGIEDNIALLAAPLMFLLKPKPSLASDDDCTLCFEPFSPAVRTQGLSSLSSSYTSEVPFAHTVHLAMVHSPDNQVAKSYDGAIKAYFSQARCLSLGDIISIPVTGDPSFLPNCQDTCEVRYPVLFFKVTELLPCQPPWTLYRVDSDHSHLTLAGLAHSFVPQSAVKFWSRQSCSSMWQTKSPAGFDQYVSSITLWILPYLVQKPIRSEQMFPTILLEGVAGVGKSEVIKAAAFQLDMNVVQIACSDLCGESSAATEARLRNAIQRAASFVPCIVHLRDVQSLGKDRDGRSEDTRVSSSFKQILRVVFCTITDWPMVVMATTKSATYVSPEIRDCFLRELKLEPPDEVQRRCMIESLLDLDECSPGLDVKHIAQRTAGLVLGDLSALVSHARRVAYNRILATCSGGRPLTLSEERDICAAGVTLLQSDVETALDQLQSAHSDALGAPKIPDVTWDDIGGLADVKADILDTIQLPLEHPELFATGLRRSGVLLYGPPGTGKTLLAKAVATECSLNFLSVKGPELINMYVGQSEENVREVFNRARNASPCVIFFDELDSLAPNRGRSGDSGGVMDRVVSQLLAELDGLHKSCDIFVIGATNRPDLLDPALLRPGRFDKLIYLGVCEDKNAQLKILKALTRKFHLSSNGCLDYILQSCPGNLTGADFYALCSDAMLCAMKRKIQLLEAGEPVDQSKVEVKNEDFLTALKGLVPSVSREEMERYTDLQDTFKNSH